MSGDETVIKAEDHLFSLRTFVVLELNARLPKPGVQKAETEYSAVCLTV